MKRGSAFAKRVMLGLAALLGVVVHGTAAAAPAAGKAEEVRAIRDVAYYEGKDADPLKHKLDLYLPRDGKDFPVLFFVHGGAWRHGDKKHFGIYAAFGATLAHHGIGVVVPNYRLSPAVTHPEHIKDVARAFAWTVKHIGNYGGRADAIFIGGHSAGGHLTALLATDESYLKAEGLSLRAVKGVIPMSGVYEIPEHALFDPIFGKDPEVRKQASPLTHARPDAPPFLILYAENDLPGCDKPAAEAFFKALKDKKCPAEALEVKKRNHLTILLNASVDDDPVAVAIRTFIFAHVPSKPALPPGAPG
jgi:acetyl esterase/lipase